MSDGSARRCLRGKLLRGPGLCRAACLLAFLALAAAAPAQRVPEYTLKAELVERVTRFVDWPAASFADPQQPFVVAVLGESPLAEQLIHLGRETPFKGRTLVLRAVRTAAEANGAHALFIAGSQRATLGEVLAATGTAPILTIADTPGFAKRGVHVNFYVLDEAVRFELNPEAAEASGLKLSSRLLRLARLVGPTERK